MSWRKCSKGNIKVNTDISSCVTLTFWKKSLAIFTLPSERQLNVGWHKNFNVKLERRQDESNNSLGNYGFGERNERAVRLPNFLQEYGLYFKSNYEKMCTRLSKDLKRFLDYEAKNYIQFNTSNAQYHIHYPTQKKSHRVVMNKRNSKLTWTYGCLSNFDTQKVWIPHSS